MWKPAASLRREAWSPSKQEHPMPANVSSLIIQLIDRVTAPARGISKTISGLNQSIGANQRSLDGMRGRMFDAVGAGYALSRALGAPLKSAMEFESAMADVAKVVEFSSPTGFKEFQKTILDMSTRIPMAATGLGEIAAAAGQAGLALEEIIPFTEMAAKVGTAFDISAGQAGDALAKLKTGLGLTIPQTALMADAMNHLSNAMASSAPDILDVVRRVGAQGKQFGFNEIQVSAFASAMLSAGAESEVAATSFRNMGKALTRGASATKSQRAAYRQLGLDSVKVSKAMQKDAVGTTIRVLERIGQLPKHMQASISSDLFGDEARALGPLLTNLPLLKQALGLVAQEAQYAGSANKEFEARSKTFANAVQLMRNRAERLGIVIGTVLIPPISDLMEKLTPLVEGVREIAEAHPQLVRNVTMAAAALVSFRVAAIGAQWAGLFMKGAVLQIAAGALSATKAMGTLAKALLITPVVTAVTAAFNGLRTALIGYTAAAAIAGHGTALKLMATSLLALLNPINLVRGALNLLKVTLISTGIGAALVAIGTAGAFIYQNWNGIGIAFEAFKGAFDRAIAPIKPALEPITSAISDLFGWVSKLTGPIDESGDAWARWGIAAGKAVGDALVAIVNGASDLYQAGAAMIQSLWDGTAAKFNDFIEWVKAIPSRITSAIGSIDLSSMITLPTWLGGKEVVPAQTRPAPQAPDPSPAWTPAPRGPEIFSKPEGPSGSAFGFGPNGVNTSDLEAARVKAEQTGDAIGALNMVARPTVDASDIANTLSMVQQLHSALQRLGPAAASALQKVKEPLRPGGEYQRAKNGLYANT
jgi:TP901 family phage tail tape measure protein